MTYLIFVEQYSDWPVAERTTVGADVRLRLTASPVKSELITDRNTLQRPPASSYLHGVYTTDSHQLPTLTATVGQRSVCRSSSISSQTTRTTRTTWTRMPFSVQSSSTGTPPTRTPNYLQLHAYLASCEILHHRIA